MDTLTEIQRGLNGVECPRCLKFSFELMLRCDLNDRECLPTAKCRSCGYALNVIPKQQNFEGFSPT
jgi:ribosomal protein L34E